MKASGSNLVVAVLALLSLAAATAGRSEAPSGDAANGERIFMVYGCYACHGTTGAGGGWAGPRLAPNPLPLESVKAKLRSPAGSMPPYSAAVMRDEEIEDIVAYLQSIRAGKQAKDIPLLTH